MARVTESEVTAIIEWDGTLSLTPFIETANALVDYVVTQDSDSVLTDGLLKSIEKFLAAHFYAHRDQQYITKETENAKGDFQVAVKVGFNSTQWGQTAIRLDVTGTLASLDRTKHKVGISWAGYKESEQTDYQDRN